MNVKTPKTVKNMTKNQIQIFFERLRAIGAPIIPVPIHVTFINKPRFQMVKVLILKF